MQEPEAGEIGDQEGQTEHDRQEFKLKVGRHNQHWKKHEYLNKT